MDKIFCFTSISQILTQNSSEIIILNIHHLWHSHALDKMTNDKMIEDEKDFIPNDLDKIFAKKWLFDKITVGKMHINIMTRQN